MADEREQETLGSRLAAHKKTLAGLVVLVLAVIGFAIAASESFRRYSSYQVDWEVPLSSVISEAAVFGEGILEYERNRAVYYSLSGEQLWLVDFDMRDPVLVQEGDYAAIYDRNGQSLVICHTEEGETGRTTVTGSISNADISSAGVTALVTEGSDYSTIGYYRKDASQLEVEIRAPLATYGYPLDISIAPNGQQLLVSYYSLMDGSGQCRLVFYDWEEARGVPDRVVQAFEDYAETDTYLPIAVYQSESQAFAVGDNRVSFFHLNSRASVTRTDVEITGEIQQVFYSDTYLGLLLEQEERLMLYVYRMDGGLYASWEEDQEAEHYLFHGNNLISYDADSMKLIHLSNGLVKFERQFGNGIQFLLPGSSVAELYLGTGSELEKITLK